MGRVWWNVLAAATVAAGLLLLGALPTGARFNFRKSVELQDDIAEEGHYQAFIFIKNLKVGGSTMAGVVRQFMFLKWGTTCIEPMRREFTLSGKDGYVRDEDEDVSLSLSLSLCMSVCLSAVA